MTRRGGLKKVFIFVRGEKDRDKAAALADILYEDFEVYSEIRDVSEVWSGGIKRFKELIEGLKEKNKRLAIVCFNLRKSRCSASKCTIRQHSTVPVVPLNLGGVKNDMGFAVVQVLTALSIKKEKEEKEVRCE